MIIINHDSVGMVNTKITYCSKFIKCKTNQKFSNSLNMTNKNITNENYKKYLLAYIILLFPMSICFLYFSQINSFNSFVIISQTISRSISQYL